MSLDLSSLDPIDELTFMVRQQQTPLDAVVAVYHSSGATCAYHYKCIGAGMMGVATLCHAPSAQLTLSYGACIVCDKPFA